MPLQKLTSLEITLLLVGLTLLITIAVFFKHPAFYDEYAYLQNVPLLHKYGIGNVYLTKLYGSAGPLYSLIHYAFEPVTHLNAPYIRLVNITALLFIILFVAINLQLLKNTEWHYAFYIMATPIIYTVSGLALTEVPAMLFYSAALYFIIKTARGCELKYRNALLYAMLGGLCMNLSILGRQPYLASLPAVAFLFTFKKNTLKTLLIFLVLMFFSVVTPFYVFFMWKGLVPPSDASFYTTAMSPGPQFRIDFFILCLFYLAVCMFLAAPGFFAFPTQNKRVVLVAGYATTALLNYKFQILSYTPLAYLIKKINLSDNQLQLLSGFLGSAILLAGLFFLLNSLWHLKNNYQKKEFVFFMVSLLLIAFSCAKITWGFSSRYAAQAVPLIIIIASYFYKPTASYNLIRIAAGVTIGIISILSYFLSTPNT
jgi:hypothetical protein